MIVSMLLLVIHTFNKATNFMHSDFLKMKGLLVCFYLYITGALAAIVGINYGVNIVIIFNCSFMGNVGSYFGEVLIEYVANGLWVRYYWIINLKTNAALYCYPFSIINGFMVFQIFSRLWEDSCCYVFLRNSIMTPNARKEGSIFYIITIFFRIVDCWPSFFADFSYWCRILTPLF